MFGYILIYLDNNPLKEIKCLIFCLDYGSNNTKRLAQDLNKKE
jgi:hypothetical protein